jgi:lipopolysaccharide transport system permease protein
MATAPELMVIEPRRLGARERLSELWEYRRLARYFGAEAVDKRARKTILGRFWLVLRPLADVGVRALIFGGLLKAPSGGLPYFLFFLSGMMVFSLFAESLLWSTRGLELNGRLLSKVYMPRLLIPVSSVAPAFYELGVYAAALAVSIVGFSIADGTLYLGDALQVLAGIGALVMALALSVSIGLWTSVLGARFRDMRYSLGYLLQFAFFLTPVIYPVSALPGELQTIALLNPLAPIIEVFRWGILGVGAVHLEALALAAVVTVAIAAGGLRFFTRAEAAALDSL